METPTRPGDLQFERAERSEPPQDSPRCSLCSTEISTHYFECAGRVVCPACRERLAGGNDGGSGALRFGRAALFGSAAAAAGALLWWGVSALTGLQLSLIAIVIGYLVGSAVRLGARRRGGWLYQGLAIFLTYTSIVSAYIPEILEAMRPATTSAATGAEVDRAEGGVAATDAQEPAPPATTPADPSTAGEPAGSPTSDPSPDPAGDARALPRPVRVLAGVAAVFLIAFAAPFLGGFSNFLGWIILAIGLYEAWKLNRRIALVFDGPFAVGSSRSFAATAPSPSPPPPSIAP